MGTSTKKRGVIYKTGQTQTWVHSVGGKAPSNGKLDAATALEILLGDVVWKSVTPTSALVNQYNYFWSNDADKVANIGVNQKRYQIAADLCDTDVNAYIAASMKSTIQAIAAAQKNLPENVTFTYHPGVQKTTVTRTQSATWVTYSYSQKITQGYIDNINYANSGLAIDISTDSVISGTSSGELILILVVLDVALIALSGI